MTELVGRSVARVDGRAKVTGAARYAADQPVPGALQAFFVLSTVARGEVVSIDASAALAHPGVVAVLTHRDLPRLTVPAFPYFRRFLPMQDTAVHHVGQPVAIVLATTVEQAQEGAALVAVGYRAAQPRVVIEDAREPSYLPPPFRNLPNEIRRGDAETALAGAEVRLEARYSSATRHHNPIEPHTTTAQWDGDRLTLHESAQGVLATRTVVSAAFGLPPEAVRVVAPYLGGGFGAKGPVWPHTVLTAAAARVLRRPVRLVLSRAQMYTLTGHRAEYRQHLRIGATRTGELTSIIETSTAQLSATEESVFNRSDSTVELYACPNLHVRYEGVRLDVATSSYMRSPETTSHFGLETALDELSWQLGIDPLELRRRNHAEFDQETGERLTGKHLLDCYALAADRFGWAARLPRTGATKDGDEYVGWGMATETHTFNAMPSTASVTVGVDGKALAQLATQDIGTGTYTVISQIVADALGVPITDVQAQIGDSALPPAGMSVASATIASISGSVDQAARAARAAVVDLAVADPSSALFGAAASEVETSNGHLVHVRDRQRRDTYRAVVGRAGRPVQRTATVLNKAGHSYGVVFVEARVHARLGSVRVTRVVTAHDIGRVMNRRTARGQVLGGVTWGIGHALMEHTVFDRNIGRVVNPNLSTYLVPVNADAPPVVETLFVDKPDPASTAMGARGFGETPITGVPAAIGNAIYHATGRRVRDLPITQDKLL
ncbi:xanthine dehydrogenase, molybdenum binding subunit apoprotein [Lentzea xinjiangensis]|uniref:Xanthine dehydrogenase, molybdenum binding subunit apoprotein n=1 Tax=Lentzea xinjiangensis TaxID=402600 RepID=A0A1H9PD90_9PSEU|nr:xanthine dehydrogenase family protein molybdopterin-binding subunit [Lentzea xinjiangensis]SER46121.1 xanthine dehydrogenase, molybdenum binding subunit apoprotein [Lentzea xinjiangensis]